MKNYRWLRIALASIFTFVWAGTAWSGGAADVPKEIINLLKTSGPGSSYEVSQNIQNGLVTHTSVAITLCDQSGLTCGTKRFRTTHSQINVDGKIFFTETIDLGTGGDYLVPPQMRSQAPRPSPSQDYSRLSFRTQSADFELDINPYSPLYQEAAAVLPAVAVGIANALEDMKATAKASQQVQRAYQNVLQRLGDSFDHAVKDSANQQQAANINAGYVSALALERILKPSTSSNPAQEYKDYLSATQDPARFVEYEILPETRQQLQAKALQSSRRGFSRDALHYAEILLNQKDKGQSLEAQKSLNGYFRDGLLQTQAFGASESSPLDEATFATSSNDHGGQVVRRIGNKAQVQWLESEGLRSMAGKEQSSYVSALLALRAADESFAAGDDAEGFELASAANALLDFSVGFIQGSTSAVVGAVQALPDLAESLGSFFVLAMKDEEAAVKQVLRFVEKIPGMVGAVAAHYAQLSKDVMSGSAQVRGEAVGEVTADIILGIVSNGASGSLAKLVRGEALVAGASGRIASSLAKVESKSFVRSVAVAKSFADESKEIYKQVAKQNSEAALRISRALDKLEPQVSFEYQKIALKSPAVATTKSTMALTRAVENGVVRSADQLKVVEKLMPIMEQTPYHLDFRLVGSSEKIALIGQDMSGNVLKVREALEGLGLRVETFSVSEAAEFEWRNMVQLFPDPSTMPKNLIRSSLGYIENKAWIQKLIDQGYTVIDANNPRNRSYSIYYGEIERGMLRRVNIR